MHGRLSSRPMDVYRDLFVPRGVRWSMGVGADGAAELTVRGKMEAGDYVLPGNVSSQFVSGLLFALPLLKENSTLKVEPPVESASYIRMTIEAIRQSGIVIEELGDYHWRIPGNQVYQSQSSHLAGDYSQAAVLCCAGALGHDVTVMHLSPVTTQGDRAVLTHLRALGANVQEDENGIRVTAEKLHGAVLDMQDCPDIAPILAMTAQFAEGETRLTHCGRLRLKECDRLQATVEILNMLGGHAVADGDDMVITGVKTLRGGVTIPNYGDHRMVMMASIAATRCEAPVQMDGIEAINKSWPTFWRYIKRWEESANEQCLWAVPEAVDFRSKPWGSPGGNVGWLPGGHGDSSGEAPCADAPSCARSKSIDHGTQGSGRARVPLWCAQWSHDGTTYLCHHPQHEPAFQRLWGWR